MYEDQTWIEQQWTVISKFWEGGGVSALPKKSEVPAVVGGLQGLWFVDYWASSPFSWFLIFGKTMLNKILVIPEHFNVL